MKVKFSGNIRMPKLKIFIGIHKYSKDTTDEFQTGLWNISYCRLASSVVSFEVLSLR